LKNHEETSVILNPTIIDQFVMIFVRKTDKIFRQDKILSYCECLVRFPDKKTRTNLRRQTPKAFS